MNNGDDVHQSLFRRKAIDAKKPKLDGDIVMVSPPTLKYVVGFCALVLTGLLIAACLIQYSSVVKVSGVVVPVDGVTRVMANFSGTLVERYVSSGDMVKVGQPLFKISTGRVLDSGRILETERRALINGKRDSIKNELSSSTLMRESDKSRIKNQIEKAKRNLGSLEKQLIASDEQQGAAKSTLQRYEKLLGLGYVSQDQYVEREIVFRDRSIEFERLKSAINSERFEITALNLDLSAVDGKYRSQRESLERMLLDADRDGFENATSEAQVLVARNDGVIIFGDTNIGAALEPMRTIGMIYDPKGKLQVELFLPPSAIGGISLDSRVALKFDSFPFQKYGLQFAKINSVSAVPTPTVDLAREFGGLIKSSGIVTDQSLYLAKAILEKDSIQAFGKRRYLSPGMTVTADISIEKMPLIYWVISPYTAAKGRLSLN